MQKYWRYLSLVGLLAALAWQPFSRAADSRAETYIGIARSLDGRSELYRERHLLRRDAAGIGTRVVLYSCGEGVPYARKIVRYRDRQGAPDFSMEDARSGNREGAVREGEGLRVYSQAGAQAGERAALLDQLVNLVIDAGFDDFVRLNWDQIQQSQPVRLRFLVPSRQQIMAFTIKRQSASNFEGQPATVIRLRLGAWYGFLLPHIEVTYIDASRRLARFEGLTNKRADGGGKNIEARIDFPADLRQPLASGALEAAQTLTLAASCDPPNADLPAVAQTAD